MANDRTTDPWPALVLIGVICGIAIGTIIMLIRRRDGSGDDYRLPVTGDDGLNILPAGEPPASFRDPNLLTTPPIPVISPMARTQTINDRNPTFLLKATGPTPWTVRARVLGPPGSYATFIYSNSTSDRYVIPAGGHDTLRLPGYQSLYAVGNTIGVSVSVAGGEGA